MQIDKPKSKEESDWEEFVNYNRNRNSPKVAKVRLLEKKNSKIYSGVTVVYSENGRISR